MSRLSALITASVWRRAAACGAPSTARRLLTGVSHGRCTSADLVQPNLRKCSDSGPVRLTECFIS